jgi:hypothetical protein
LPIPPWLELFLAPFQSWGEHVFLFRKIVVLPCQHKMDVLWSSFLSYIYIYIFKCTCMSQGSYSQDS